MSDVPQRIVLVDDDGDMLKIVRESFERYAPEIVLATCSSGTELISRFGELQADLILLDLVMPDMDGPDVIKALNENQQEEHVPIIFLTGKEKVVMEEDYKYIDVIGVIHKPFSPKDLPEQVKSIWSKYKGAA